MIRLEIIKCYAFICLHENVLCVRNSTINITYLTIKKFFIQINSRSTIALFITFYDLIRNISKQFMLTKSFKKRLNFVQINTKRYNTRRKIFVPSQVLTLQKFVIF